MCLTAINGTLMLDMKDGCLNIPSALWSLFTIVQTSRRGVETDVLQKLITTRSFQNHKTDSE